MRDLCANEFTCLFRHATLLRVINVWFLFMPLRRIGQESLPFLSRDESVFDTDKIHSLINWRPIEEVLSSLYDSERGGVAWPPLSMFRALLLSQWYNLSDVKLAEFLEDRVSFRRFCGFSRAENTPECTAFVRFRKKLTDLSLDKQLFDLINDQIMDKNISVEKGAIIDATIISSHTKRDEEAKWIKHEGKPSVHGYKAHVSMEAEKGLIENFSVTPANINDGRASSEALPEKLGETYADSAYRGRFFAEEVKKRGGIPRVPVISLWLKKEECASDRIDSLNRPIYRVRCRIEKIFGTWKRSYGARKMRWIGLAKAKLQISLTALAYNLKRALNLSGSYS